MEKCLPILLLLTISLTIVFGNPAAVVINCDRVRYTMEQKGIAGNTQKGFTGTVVTICGGKDQCCTQNMQEQLKEVSRSELKKVHNETLGKLSELLKYRAHKFDDFFKDMLNNSKKDFHDMFKKTYGIIYEQNAYVFTDLFKELERYYAKGQVDLIEAMDDFFNTLYQKMFTVLNAQYSFNEKYLECVNERMKELKPFGDVPGKLSILLKRSFVATRTFSQALHVSASVVKNMQNMTMSESCHSAVMKMSHCSACQGLTEVKPCSNYCTNVMKGCLAYHSQLEPHWNTFLDSLDKVVERLLGPFNIEMVVEPIDIKISEAIMNFQENAQQVTERVFSNCGKPGLSRTRRDTGEIPFETLQFTNHGGGGKKKGNKSAEKTEESVGREGSLEWVVKETRNLLRETKGYWHKLPYHMCGSGTVAEASQPCWNGEHKAQYSPPVVGDGISNQQSNPEVTVDLNRPNSLVNEQVFALRTINSKLKNAYNGMDVEWYDNEDATFGSGSGSGYGPEEIDDTEDSGSGMGEASPTEIPTVVSVPTIIENEEPNELHPIPDLQSYNGTARTSTTGQASSSRAALLSYIVPVVLVWFGNTLCERSQ